MYFTKVKHFSGLIIAAIGLATLSTLLLSNIPAILNSIHLPRCTTIGDATRTFTACKVGLRTSSAMVAISGNWTSFYRPIGLEVSPSPRIAEAATLNDNEAWYIGHGLDINGIYFGYRIAIPWYCTPSASQAAVFMIALIFSFWLLQHALWKSAYSNAIMHSDTATDSDSYMGMEYGTDHEIPRREPPRRRASYDGICSDLDEKDHMSEMRSYHEADCRPLPGRRVRKEFHETYERWER